MDFKSLVESLGIDYTAEFVPFHQSRNAVDDPKLKDLSLNWKVKLHKNGVTLESDYMQGIGYIPGYKHRDRMTILRFEEILWACNTGLHYRHAGLTRTELPYPELVDVLHSLISDSEALEYPTFEEYAGSLGMDPDSRKAERIYRTCLEIGLRLRAMLGDSVLQQLREAAQDY